MATKYLDNTGLAYFWGKIKSYVASLLSSKADDSAVVHIAGTETITGAKTFSAYPTSKVSNNVAYKIINTGITKGDATINTWSFIPFVDSSEAESNSQGRLGYIGFNYNKKANTGILAAYNCTTATNTNYKRLAVGYDASGDWFTEAPTPDIADNSTKIATTAWVATKCGNYVPLAGGTMTGSLTMDGNNKAFIAKNNTYSVYFQVGSNGINRGLWDVYLNKWIVYANDSNAFLNGNASTATKLATARSLKTKLDSTTAVTFDGSADQNEIPVTGTLPVANGGTGATSVSDVQERFFEPTPHHSASYDLDTFIASGIDSFASDTTLTNCPDGYNGILWTFGTEGMQKQFWSRTGTLDLNDHYIGFRTRYNGNWSGWHKIYTDSDTVPVANGGTGLTSLATFVRTQDAQTIGGAKTFSNDATFSSAVIMAGNIRKNADNDELYVCGGSGGSNVKGAYLRLKGVSASSNAGLFFLCTAKVSDSYANLNGYPNGTLTWNGQNIQTSSDERLKTPLSAVPDDVLDAWGDVQWGRFQYLDAVARKGASARLHLGLIAQRVKAVFEARGLDACAYGILCYDTVDEIWMVRYAEAAAMEACYQRRRADRLEARIAALEAVLQ